MTTNDARRRRLGTVVEVTADHLRIEMTESADGYTLVGFDDQHYVARIGSLVLIPLTNTYVVAEVTGLQERPQPQDRSSASRSMQDVAPSSVRHLSVSPLGTLPFDELSPFSFGVSEYPPLFADVLHVENRDLDRILNVADQEIAVDSSSIGATKFNSLTIGTSVIFNDYDVKLRTNEFFGAHSAILGNTGSGKSCTIASLLQVTLEKPNLFPAVGSTFVVFDTNGEYRRAVSELPSPIRRRFARVDHPLAMALEPPDPYDDREELGIFSLPHWLLSHDEWDLLCQTAEKVQRPVLRNALGLTSLFAIDSTRELETVRNHILASCLLHLLLASENHTAARSKISGLLNYYETSDIRRSDIEPRLGLNYGVFTQQNLEWLTAKLQSLRQPEVDIPSYKNAPFAFESLAPAIELAILYEESFGNSRVRDNCATLLTRIKTLQSRDEFNFLRGDMTIGSNPPTTKSFVDEIFGIQQIGGIRSKVSQVYILDLSTIDDEAVEVVSSVVTRMLFDRLRRNGQRNTFPVNLILEEAHRYIPKQAPASSGMDATKIFERVAKEGRKYGLFLLLSSQRPSELSGTVLSQCSNYIVHRIQNPEDLQHIKRMTPFISESVLNRLASLPKQFALVFGTAVSIPTSFRVRSAAPLPYSDDSDVASFWYQTPGAISGLPS